MSLPDRVRSNLAQEGSLGKSHLGDVGLTLSANRPIAPMFKRLVVDSATIRIVKYSSITSVVPYRLAGLRRSTPSRQSDLVGFDI
jgi:hypothetical protein